MARGCGNVKSVRGSSRNWSRLSSGRGLFSSESEEKSEGRINRGRVLEHRGDVGIEKHHVRALSVGFEVLPADSRREVVFGPKIVVSSCFLTHSPVAEGATRPAA